jgi:hypothetical protein
MQFSWFILVPPDKRLFAALSYASSSSFHTPANSQNTLKFDALQRGLLTELC